MHARVLLLIVILRLVVGGFWFEHSRQKWGWFVNNGLESQLTRWNRNAEGLQKLYIERFCLPFAGKLQYFVVLGELAVGLSFLFGYLTRIAALGGVLMAASFLFAQGSLQTWDVIGNPYGPMTMMATIVASYAGGEARWSLRSLRATGRGPS